MRGNRRRSLLLGLWLAAAPACSEEILLPGLLPLPDAEAPGEEGPPAQVEPLPTEPPDEDAGVDPAVDARPPSRDAGPGLDARSGRDASVSPPACAPGRPIETTRTAGTAVVALDRSQSMFFGARFGPSGSRIQAAQTALRELVRRYPRSIKFSYTEFPAHRCPANACCVSLPTSPVFSAAPVIEDRMRCDSASSGCFDLSADAPAHAALEVLDRLFSASFFRSPAHILLLADGDPSCGARTDVCDAAQEHVTKLRNRGVETSVIGISEDVKTTSCLSRLALYGSSDDKAQAPYYRLALDEGQLRAHLAELGRKIATHACRITLQAAPANRDAVLVLLDGRAVPRDPNDGWDYVPGSTLRMTLNGRACEALIVSTSREDPVEVFSCR
jgi:hypothetical protein